LATDFSYTWQVDGQIFMPFSVRITPLNSVIGCTIEAQSLF